MSEENRKIEEILIEALTNPKSGEADGQKFEQHSIADIIKGLNYYASVKNNKSKRSGLRFHKMHHGGAE